MEYSELNTQLPIAGRASVYGMPRCRSSLVFYGRRLVSRVGASLGIVLMSLAGTSVAMADEKKVEGPCNPLAAPVSLSLRETGFDAPHSACANNSWSLGTRALALIDTPNFYGTVGASVFFDWRFVHASGFEFGMGAKLIDARFVQSAVFSDTELNVGPLYLSIAKPTPKTWWNKDVVVSHALRVDVPLTSTSNEALTVSASPSVSASISLAPTLQLHSRIAALLWSTVPESGADSRTAFQSSLDIGYTPASSLALLLGAEAQSGWYGLGLDHLQARAGLRIATGQKGAIELSGGQVVVGTEGKTLVVWLGYKSTSAPKAKKKSSRRDRFLGRGEK